MQSLSRDLIKCPPRLTGFFRSKSADKTTMMRNIGLVDLRCESKWALIGFKVHPD
jgi:hypothetical protein